jgi:hypothetical protein
MHTFVVRSERDGWSVGLGDAVTTHFRSRDAAIAEADRLCEALRRHGETACVVVDSAAPGGTPQSPIAWSGTRAYREARNL